MSARDKYPPFTGMHRHGEAGRYEEMCDEIDRLRAENERLRESSRGMSRHIVRRGMEAQAEDTEVSQ